MRPIQRYGASPDGVHQFLWLRSRNGYFQADYRMLALEFGCGRDRFLDYLEHLVERNDLRAIRPVANGRLEQFCVRMPLGLEEELQEIYEQAQELVENFDPDEVEEFDPDEDYDAEEHKHKASRTWHIHAWASEDHDHVKGTVCRRPECDGWEPHGVHFSPEDEPEDEDDQRSQSR